MDLVWRNGKGANHLEIASLNLIDLKGCHLWHQSSIAHNQNQTSVDAKIVQGASAEFEIAAVAAVSSGDGEAAASSDAVAEAPTDAGVAEVPADAGVAETPTDAGVAGAPTDAGVAEAPTDADVAEAPIGDAVGEAPTDAAVDAVVLRDVPYLQQDDGTAGY